MSFSDYSLRKKRQVRLGLNNSDSRSLCRSIRMSVCVSLCLYPSSRLSRMSLSLCPLLSVSLTQAVSVCLSRRISACLRLPIFTSFSLSPSVSVFIRLSLRLSTPAYLPVLIQSVSVCFCLPACMFVSSISISIRLSLCLRLFACVSVSLYGMSLNKH